MCKSAADGGQRCAAHTREVFGRAEATLTALMSGDPDGPDFDDDCDGWRGDRDEVTRAEDLVTAAAVQYASTDEGLQVVLGRQTAAETSGDEWRAASWRRAAQSGQELRARSVQARADDRAPARADGELPVLAEDRGKALTAEVQRRLAAAGLVRTSRFAGGENTGWTTAFGSTGFSVGNAVEPAPGTRWLPASGSTSSWAGSRAVWTTGRAVGPALTERPRVMNRSSRNGSTRGSRPCSRRWVFRG